MLKRIIYILLAIVLLILLFFWVYLFFCNKEIPVDNSGFVLVDDLKIEIYDEVNISSKIKSIDGQILKDAMVVSDILGTQSIEFLYENSTGKKRRGIVDVEVVDTTVPIILLNNTYTVYVGSDLNLLEVILSADNYDSKPLREIIGEYDMNQVGNYPLIYKVTDSSGNVTTKEFTLKVIEKRYGSSYSSTYTDFNDIISLHKNDKTKIGIDVSKWQGNIDFDKIKAAGVEFIIMRVGTGLGFDAESIVDPYFIRNMEEAKRAGIPVGIYYYSYASSVEDAKEQASWVVEQVKPYDIELPIVFDWETWSYFNGLNLSLYDINNIADTFLSEVKNAGYDAMLYSSKYYLQNIWNLDYPVWLAHYTVQTDYEGKYDIWQLCQDGKIDGISGAVDIDVLYK